MMGARVGYVVIVTDASSSQQIGNAAPPPPPIHSGFKYFHWVGVTESSWDTCFECCPTIGSEWRPGA